MRSTTAPAFTLLEVLLVIVLLGAVVVFAWPDFGESVRREQLDQSARRISALVAMCRAQAMNESRRYRVMLHSDGQVRCSRQLDALTAPNQYVRVKHDWAHMEFALDGVWVEAAAALPYGPAPVIIEDELVVAEDHVVELVPVGELDGPVLIEFAPDGSSNSAQWLLRDTRGRGLQMTLDGRLGRVRIELAESVSPEEVVRPDVELDEDELYAEETKR